MATYDGASVRHSTDSGRSFRGSRRNSPLCCTFEVFRNRILEEKPPIKMGGKGAQLREGTVTLHAFRGISFPHLCLGRLTGDASAGMASVSVPLSTPVVSLGAPHR